MCVFFLFCFFNQQRHYFLLLFFIWGEGRWMGCLCLQGGESWHSEPQIPYFRGSTHWNFLSLKGVTALCLYRLQTKFYIYRHSHCPLKKCKVGYVCCPTSHDQVTENCIKQLFLNYKMPELQRICPPTPTTARCPCLHPHPPQ